jgi:hypothetical protein
LGGAGNAGTAITRAAVAAGCQCAAFENFNRHHLERVLYEYVDLYNDARPHRLLGPQPPRGSGPATPIGPILRRQRLGGLINEYERGPATRATEHEAGAGLALARLTE